MAGTICRSNTKSSGFLTLMSGKDSNGKVANMKSVLVTGASGFIGRQSLAPLIHRNFQVHAIFSEGSPPFKHPNIFWYQLNLHDEKAIKKILNDIMPSHLLHLAWYAKPNEYWTSPFNLTWLMSSISLLGEFIKVGGKRAVFAGSCAEYDWKYGHCREFSTPCNPQTLYGAAKHSLHLLSDALCAQQSLSFAWGRIFFLFGSHEYPQRLIPSLISHLLGQKKFILKNGAQVRDFMYVEDVADALVALLDSEVKGPVNIASGKPLAIRELVAKVAYKLGSPELVSYQQPPALIAMHDAVVTADAMRLHAEVKWDPKHSLDVALDKTIAWWSENA